MNHLGVFMTKVSAVIITGVLFAGAVAGQAGSEVFARHHNDRRTEAVPATNYSIVLAQNSSHIYTAGEQIRVTVSTNKSGGGLENDIAAQSQTVPNGTSTFSLGQVPSPGVYFTRYVVGGESFPTSFLVLPVSANTFTVEILNTPVRAVEVNSTTRPVLEKYFSNLNSTRLKAAASAIAPGWFAQNGQNFVVLVAKGIVLTYSGIGFIAVMAEKDIAADVFGLALDFVAAVLARAADDMVTAHILTNVERNNVKQGIAALNTVAQTALSTDLITKIISFAQGAHETLGDGENGKILGKIAGDSAKKFHVMIQLAKH